MVSNQEEIQMNDWSAPIPVHGLAIIPILMGAWWTRSSIPSEVTMGWVSVGVGILMVVLLLLVDICPDKVRAVLSHCRRKAR